MERSCSENNKRASGESIDRVIQVAGQLFSERGYDGVGIREIALESGMTMPSIFYHFESKSSLYEEVIQYKYQAHTGTIANNLKPIRHPRARLECIIGSLFDIISADREFLLFLQRDVIELVARHDRPGFVKTYQWLSILISDLLQAALIAPAERQVAISLLSLILGSCELTAALAPGKPGSSEWNAWYAEQRAELIHQGERIVLERVHSNQM